MRGGRPVALRQAVQSGVWDADVIANAVLGAEPVSGAGSQSS
jgi:hypothetical protein